MSDKDVFYPNNLSKEEIDSLEGWQLEVACIHFSVSRDACVKYGYGYALKEVRDGWDTEKLPHLVADKNGIYKRPISLKGETDTTPSGLLGELGLQWKDLLRQAIADKHKEWFGGDDNS